MKSMIVRLSNPRLVGSLVLALTLSLGLFYVLHTEDAGVTEGRGRTREEQQSPAPQAAMPHQGLARADSTESADTSARAAVEASSSSEGRVLRGRTVSHGQPLAGVTVYLGATGLEPQGGFDQLDSSVVTGDDGIFGFSHVEYGPQDVCFRSDACIAYTRSVVLPVSSCALDLGDVDLTRGVILEGRVEEANGHGVPHTDVWVMPGSLSARGHAGTDIQASMARFVGHQAGGTPIEGSRVATTDELGGFRTEPIPVGPWRIKIAADGFLVFEATGAAGYAGTSSGHVFVLDHGHSISGRVIAPDGYQLNHVRVAARPRDNGLDRSNHRSSFCKEDGAFCIQGFAPKSVDDSMIVELFNRAGWRETTEAPVVARVDDSDVRIRLVPPSWMRFALLDAQTQEPLTDPSGRLDFWAGTSLRSSVDMKAMLQFDAPRGEHVVRVPAAQIEPLDLGLFVSHQAYEGYYAAGIRLAPGETMDLGLVRLQPQVSVNVEVRGPQNEGVADATLALRRVAPGGSITDDVVSRVRRGESHFAYGEPRYETKTDHTGNAVLPGLTGVAYDLTVSHPKYAPARFRSVRVEEWPTMVQMHKGATVEVLVLEGEQPAEGAVVLHYQDSHATSNRPSVRFENAMDSMISDPKGRVQFARLSFGRHLFRIQGSKNEWAVVNVSSAIPVVLSLVK